MLSLLPQPAAIRANADDRADQCDESACSSRCSSGRIGPVTTGNLLAADRSGLLDQARCGRRRARGWSSAPGPKPARRRAPARQPWTRRAWARSSGSPRTVKPWRGWRSATRWTPVRVELPAAHRRARRGRSRRGPGAGAASARRDLRVEVQRDRVEHVVAQGRPRAASDSRNSAATSAPAKVKQLSVERAHRLEGVVVEHRRGEERLVVDTRPPRRPPAPARRCRSGSRARRPSDRAAAQASTTSRAKARVGRGQLRGVGAGAAHPRPAEQHPRQHPGGGQHGGGEEPGLLAAAEDPARPAAPLDRADLPQQGAQSRPSLEPLRRAGSGCRCRARRRSTSSPGPSPCRCAPSRAAGW